MEKPTTLMPVPTDELYVGGSVPWPIYDRNGKLLLAAGLVIQNQGQLDGLMAKGLFHSGPQLEEGSSPRDMHFAAAGKSPSTTKPSDIAVSREGEFSNNEDSTIEMDDVQWQVGEVLQLQFDNNPSVRYTVRLIGYIKNHSLLISNPMREGRVEYLREGQNLIIRAFPGKSVYSFLCSVNKTIYSPHLYLHLSYPRRINKATIRRTSRVSVSIIASLSLDRHEASYTTILNDLSMGGTGGIAHEKIGNKGDTGRVKFKLRVADEDYFLNLRVVLCSVEVLEQASNFKYGIQFIEPTKEEKLILAAFFYQKSIESSLT